jgi:hypothetical protein
MNEENEWRFLNVQKLQWELAHLLVGEETALEKISEVSRPHFESKTESSNPSGYNQETGGRGGGGEELGVHDNWTKWCPQNANNITYFSSPTLWYHVSDRSVNMAGTNNYNYVLEGEGQLCSVLAYMAYLNTVTVSTTPRGKISMLPCPYNSDFMFCVSRNMSNIVKVKGQK